MVPIVVVIHVPFMSWGTHDHQGRRRRIGLETSQEKEDDKSQCIKDPNAKVSLLQEGSWCGKDLGGVIQSVASSNPTDCYIYTGPHLGRIRPIGECPKREDRAALVYAEDGESEPLIWGTTLQLS